MTPSVNYTIGIGIVEEAGYRMGEGGGGGGGGRHKFCISGLKVHRYKTHMESESSNECSVLFLWTKESF